jgi:hypothetical protein
MNRYTFFILNRALENVGFSAANTPAHINKYMEAVSGAAGELRYVIKHPNFSPSALEMSITTKEITIKNLKNTIRKNWIFHLMKKNWKF